MKKRRILEYFAGDPDTVYDTENGFEAEWNDDDTKCFGFFPINLEGGYEFLVGNFTHMALASKAAKKIAGKALSHINDIYLNGWITDKCYEKSYGLGRYWEMRNIIAFWEEPSSDLLADIVKRLGINENDYYIVCKNNHENIKVSKYITLGRSGKTGEAEKEKPFMIDQKVAEIIRSYNKPQETWQSMKEKEGWKSLAQRNATLYGENKVIKEYYDGNPDTLNVYNDDTDECTATFHYTGPNIISFGYFQNTIGRPKVFMFNDKLSHNEIAEECAKEYLGKAFHQLESEFRNIWYEIYHLGACKGRIFLTPKVFTSWRQLSSRKVKEIVEKIGLSNPEQYTYVIHGQEFNLLDYMDSHVDSPTNDDVKLLNTLVDSYLDEDVFEKIKAINNEGGSKLAAKTAKLGNMTIAQYNSLIHQESKKPKKTIKENKVNMKENKYQEEFSNYISIMNEALQKNDFKAYEYAKDMLEEAIEDSKHEKALLKEMETNNFGILNHIFENELPTLLKTNKKAVRNVIKTIKEDKNLLGQFNFYNVIREHYKGKAATNMKATELLEQLAKIVSEDVDLATVKASNVKLRKVMVESGIIPTKFVDEESKALYKNGNIILTKKKSTSNMIPLMESYDAVCKYMESHKNDKVNEGKDIDKLIEDFENKLKDNLNESEISFVQQITDFRSPIAEQRKEKLFNKFKNECISKINEMLKEDSENSDLKGLSEQINEMQFNKETIVKDIAKLLEIRDILMDD